MKLNICSLKLFSVQKALSRICLQTISFAWALLMSTHNISFHIATDKALFSFEKC